MKTPTTTARMAGVLYLILIITGIFGIMYVPSQIIVSGDTSATANNILASPLFYKAGIVSALACQTTFLLLVLVLYKLLKHVNPLHARAMVLFVGVAVPIAFINSLNEFAPLILLNDLNYVKAFSTEQVHAQIVVFRKFYNHGILVAQVFWGLWLFPLGYLAFKSGMFPKVLGVLLMMACFSYLIDFAVKNFLPDYMEITYPGNVISMVAEFGFTIYLLIKGVKTGSPDYRVSVSS